ncbi:hypothetical protein QVD17_37914 [Tagetes erecta]|uniref:SWIM-type domain-containing protein n=1 Tax=Tagetes erecta TaxID=13708 RepID=A0AAD8JXN4_TARER|nr:hypothetical protein QVD17_37914 [Tagetes erecta]
MSRTSKGWFQEMGVDVQAKTCSCMKWELTGIPCKHAVTVNWNMGSNAMNVGLPESWVSDVYRPKKKRRKAKDEMMSKVALEGKLTRSGHLKHCSKCKNAGHNSRSCKG